jgi:hypothetical protein
MDEQNIMQKTRQQEKVNSIAVTADNIARPKNNQHMMSNMNTTQRHTVSIM